MTTQRKVPGHSEATAPVIEDIRGRTPFLPLLLNGSGIETNSERQRSRQFDEKQTGISGAKALDLVLSC